MERVVGGWRPSAALIPAFIAVAAIGYVLGHSGARGGSSTPRRIARSAHVLVEYPAGWTPALDGPSIPGLAITQPQRFAPGGHATEAGLLLGALPPNELAPLPSAFVSQLRRLPSAAVIDLPEGQAYRYALQSLSDFRGALTVFVVPNPGGEPTVLACYAPTPSSRYMRACERTVFGVTVVGQPQILRLTPEPAYAAKISEAIAVLERVRLGLNRELRPQITAARAELLATRLREAFAGADATLSQLEPPSTVQPAQTQLASSLLSARDGYAAVVSAVGERSYAGYVAARKRVATAEADVDRSLGNFVLLGYDAGLTEASVSQH
jgi:hypothetical protein